MKKALTTGDIAEYCQVTHRTVLDWVIQGKIKAYQTPGRHTRVLVNDFIEFCHEYKIPIDDELRENAGDDKDRILIVDDDQQMVSALNRFLTLQEDLKIATAYSGFSAGTKFVQFKPHIVILDVLMPGLNGIDVCESIRACQEYNSVKILAITGDSSKDLPERMREAGADDFLLKPFSNDELLTKLRGLRPKRRQKQFK
ncbi:MAG: response regulator [Candidatus Omnitrophica bacterium]|nr:response regulator [Candidatus Omnitrophota bacterium]